MFTWFQKPFPKMHAQVWEKFLRSATAWSKRSGYFQNLLHHNLEDKQLRYRCCPISPEAKAIRQWNMVSYKNSFLKINRSALILEKKALIMPILKFTIQNVVLRVSRRKNSEIFLRGPCFFCFFLTFDKMFVEWPSLHETSPASKNVLLRAW